MVGIKGPVLTWRIVRKGKRLQLLVLSNQGIREWLVGNVGLFLISGFYRDHISY